MDSFTVAFTGIVMFFGGLTIAGLVAIYLERRKPRARKP